MAPSIDPLAAYREALRRTEGLRLVEILRSLGHPEPMPKPSTLAEAVVEALSEPGVAALRLDGLSRDARMALGLLALAERSRGPAAGLALGLRCLGADPVEAIGELVDAGLLAALPGPDRPPVLEAARLFAGGNIPDDLTLVAHPAALAASATLPPVAEALPTVDEVRQQREADGLEPILRLAALWQIVDEAPLRRTQQDTLYKRDRERIDDDPVLAGPIVDALEPLPDAPSLWLELARGVGLVGDEPGSDRVVAAPAEFWADNAYHLSQMVMQRWLGLSTWHEQAGMQGPGAAATLGPPFARGAAMLWLATLGAEAWATLDDLHAALARHAPGWDLPALGMGEGTSKPRADRGKKGPKPAAERASPLIASMLLGLPYQLGLVRAAESPAGERVVQLTPLGRYALGLGPPPPPRPTFDHFLFVQPNFEVVAYRQGLNAGLIGQFSRFARWSQVGSALELRLSPESVYRGLEGGMTPEQMLARLQKHSPHPLSAAVVEAVKTWSSRRERVTYHAAATLVEFASAEAMEVALAEWPATESPPIRVAERLLLVPDEASIPFSRFRLAGSRDYRRPAEACVEVEPDGVTLGLDLGRSDLFVDAEVGRFADELPGAGTPASRRRDRVTAGSLRRAIEDGLTAGGLSKWFAQRAAAELPPAVRLLMFAVEPGAGRLRADRPVVLHAPTADVLDGLMQYPSTRELIGERLGPASAIVDPASVERLKGALAALGVALDGA